MKKYVRDRIKALEEARIIKQEKRIKDPHVRQALDVSFLKEDWEINMYANALRRAQNWAKYVR